jgi:hypothetical protein
LYWQVFSASETYIRSQLEADPAEKADSTPRRALDPTVYQRFGGAPTTLARAE